MNKLKIISSAALGLSVFSLSLAGTNPRVAKALSSSVYSFTNDTYTLTYDNNNIVLKFRNSDRHNKTNGIRLYDGGSNKYYDFEKNTYDFKLPLNQDLRSGNYTLVFTDSSFSNSTSKELYSPIYINFPENSNQNVSITSLNPLVSLVNSNGTYKLNARFNILNIQDTIVDGKILNNQGSQIGFLENKSNPRNYIFNLGTTPLVLGDSYFVEYTLKNKKNELKTIKVPFTYTSNSVNLAPISTKDFMYKAKINDDKTVDVNLKFKNVNVMDLSFFDSNNIGIQLTPEIDDKGTITFKNLPENSIIQVQIKNGSKTYSLSFKVPKENVNVDTPIPFLKFINSSGVILKKGTTISVPAIREDLLATEFTTPNTYAKFVAYDEFGTETDLTNEVRISTSNSNINFTANMNLGSITKNSVVYLKIYTPTNAIVYPFNVVATSSTTQSIAFDVIKNPSNNNKISLTFRANSNLLSSNESFAEGDLLIINDNINATLAPDKKSFTINVSKDQLKNGTNTYTFIRNGGSTNTSYLTGEFLANTYPTSMKVGGAIDSISSNINNQKELILRLNLNNALTNNTSSSSVRILDEQQKPIDLKTTTSQVGSSRVLEIVISPYTQLINGKLYTLEFSNGVNNYKTSFVYNKDVDYKLNLNLTYESDSKFTIKNLSTVEGSNNKFSLKIYNTSNESEVIYNNLDKNSDGEVFKTDTITRELTNGKKFVDNTNYTIELKNLATKDVYKEQFNFKASSIPSSNKGDREMSIKSSTIKYDSNGISFDYELPNNKYLSSVETNIKELEANFDNKKITVTKLIPVKLYKGLTVKVNFTDGSSQLLKLEDFTSQKSTDELKNYLSRVYTTTLTPITQTDKSKMRYADEEGFNYWYGLLSRQEISGPEFIMQVLDANEFNAVQNTPENKIRALYPIIVNRTGDTVGVNFWIKEYTDSIQKYNSEDVALKTTIAKMLNETEPKEFFRSIGIRAE